MPNAKCPSPDLCNPNRMHLIAARVGNSAGADRTNDLQNGSEKSKVYDTLSNQGGANEGKMRNETLEVGATGAGRWSGRPWMGWASLVLGVLAVIWTALALPIEIIASTLVWTATFPFVFYWVWSITVAILGIIATVLGVAGLLGRRAGRRLAPSIAGTALGLTAIALPIVASALVMWFQATATSPQSF